MDIPIATQPDDETCGPTCLHAIYRYFGDTITLHQVIDEVERVSNGGTLEALLAKHALQRGYDVTSYVYNLNVMDPSWFKPKSLSNTQLIEKLLQQLNVEEKAYLRETGQAYVDMLELGGSILYKDINIRLINSYLKRGIPILTGLCATYLYDTPREYIPKRGALAYDDINGVPCGHFVVISGYDESESNFIVADPHQPNPISSDNHYTVSRSKLINSIMLGALTNDANLLIITPKQ